MARITNNLHSSSSSNHHYDSDLSRSGSPSSGAHTLASCYTVDAASMMLQGFHYSTTGAGGGTPSPPTSPPLAATTTNATLKNESRRRRGAAHTVAEECERLFCGTLGAVFLGEGGRFDSKEAQNPLATGAHYTTTMRHGLVTPGQSPEVVAKDGIAATSAAEERGKMLVGKWLEVFDYRGGCRFRGFIAGEDEERTLFVFFDESVIGNDLKPGLMALLELCEAPDIDCTKLVACVDRHAQPEQLVTLTRDLGWVGFEPYMLVDWTKSDDILSDAWLFLSMDV